MANLPAAAGEMRIECPRLPASLSDSMKIHHLLFLAVTAAPLTLSSAEKSAPRSSVEVTVKRTKVPSGEKLNLVSNTASVPSNGGVQGTLSINVGTTAAPHYWTVQYEVSAGDGQIYIEVADVALLRQGTMDGTTSVYPVNLFEVNAPFSGSGSVTIYRTQEESLTLEISPATPPATTDPGK
jgi:hypothetical protein